jgi:hypothetical protein
VPGSFVPLSPLHPNKSRVGTNRYSFRVTEQPTVEMEELVFDETRVAVALRTTRSVEKRIEVVPHHAVQDHFLRLVSAVGPG